jgi:hypothetical protein
MPARSQRVLLSDHHNSFEAEWDPLDPNDCNKQARAIYLALINFNALAYTVYTDVPSSTLNQLKVLAQYQMFVELLNYFYCGVKHFLNSCNVLGIDQQLLWRLDAERNELSNNIRRMTHTWIFPFRETGAALRDRLKDIPNEDLFELYLWIELGKLLQQSRPHTISKFFPFYSQVGHRVCFIIIIVVLLYSILNTLKAYVEFPFLSLLTPPYDYEPYTGIVSVERSGPIS